MRARAQHAPLGAPAAASLLDEAWDEAALASLVGDEAAVPRAVWEAALLGPARDILSRPGKGFRSTLVGLAFRLAGGDRPPPALPLLLEVIHAGSLVIDDVEDDSSERRGRACLHRLHGVPLAINTGNWLYFWPLELCGQLGLAPPVEAQLRAVVSRAMFHCHFGQALDLGTPIAHTPQPWVPPVVRAAARLKTGSLMELAARAAALVAGAPPDRAEALGRFGRRLGVGLQMLDDLGNLAAAGGGGAGKRHEDLKLGRPTWPWAWLAGDLDGPAFAALQAEARALGALARAGAPADGEPLASRMRAALGLRGRRAARVHLERAFADLEAAVGAAPELALVREEIARLEAAYG